MHDYSRASTEGARRQFELAISLDPKNAAAHAGLADATRWRGSWEDAEPGAAWDREGRRLVARAIELDPTLPEAHASLALIHWDDWEWAAAEKEFKLALALNPSYSLAHHWFGAVLEDLGRADEALAEFTLAEGADPLYPVNLTALATLLAWLGRPDEALTRIQKLAQVTPESYEYYVCLSFYHFSLSDLTSCVQDLRKLWEVAPDPSLKLLQLALYHTMAGENEKARETMQLVEASPERHSYAIIAWVYAHMGDLDACFRWLELGFQRRLLEIGGFRLYPALDPRFGELLRKMHLA
jgi:serine/threonine-protein kinase